MESVSNDQSDKTIKDTIDKIIKSHNPEEEFIDTVIDLHNSNLAIYKGVRAKSPNDIAQRWGYNAIITGLYGQAVTNLIFVEHIEVSRTKLIRSHIGSLELSQFVKLLEEWANLLSILAGSVEFLKSNDKNHQEKDNKDMERSLAKALTKTKKVARDKGITQYNLDSEDDCVKTMKDAELELSQTWEFFERLIEVFDAAASV